MSFRTWGASEVSLYMVGETDEPKLAKYRNDIVLEVGKEYSLSIDLNTGDLSISFDSSGCEGMGWRNATGGCGHSEVERKGG